MKRFSITPDNKRIGGELRGKCFICGLDTTLNVHSKCGLVPIKPKTDTNNLPERICDNLDCLKSYQPIKGNQKFCPKCVAARKVREVAMITTRLCNNY